MIENINTLHEAVNKASEIMYHVIKEIQTEGRGRSINHNPLYDFLDKLCLKYGWNYGIKLGKNASGHKMDFGVRKSIWDHETYFFITDKKDKIYLDSLGNIWDEVQAELRENTINELLQ